MSAMVKAIRVVDISNLPDMVDLVEHIEDTGSPFVLKLRRHVVAMLEPAHDDDPRVQAHMPTAEDVDAFRRAAGSWDEDSAEIVLRNLAERRAERVPPEAGQ
jgi:hypothetical protein